jgi:hypothetical protein
MLTDDNYQIHAFCDIPGNIGYAMKGKLIRTEAVKPSSTFSTTS